MQALHRTAFRNLGRTPSFPPSRRMGDVIWVLCQKTPTSIQPHPRFIRSVLVGRKGRIFQTAAALKSKRVAISLQGQRDWCRLGRHITAATRPLSLVYSSSPAAKDCRGAFSDNERPWLPSGFTMNPHARQGFPQRVYDLQRGLFQWTERPTRKTHCLGVRH